MLISQKLSFFSLSEILPPTSKGMQKYSKYVYSRQSSIGTIASVESSTWNKFPLKCKPTTSNSAWGPPPHLSSFHPSILPPFLPFTRPLPTPPPHPQPLRFLHFCPPPDHFSHHVWNKLNMKLQDREEEKKKKVQRAPERKCDRDREKGKTLGEKRWKEKTEKGFPFCSFPTWQNAPLYPGEGHGLW